MAELKQALQRPSCGWSGWRECGGDHHRGSARHRRRRCADAGLQKSSLRVVRAFFFVSFDGDVGAGGGGIVTLGRKAACGA